MGRFLVLLKAISDITDRYIGNIFTTTLSFYTFDNKPIITHTKNIPNLTDVCTELNDKKEQLKFYLSGDTSAFISQSIWTQTHGILQYKVQSTVSILARTIQWHMEKIWSNKVLKLVWKYQKAFLWKLKLGLW